MVAWSAVALDIGRGAAGGSLTGEVVGGMLGRSCSTGRAGVVLG